MAFGPSSSTPVCLCLLFFLLASILQVSHQIDPDKEIKYDFFPFFRVYKSGRVQRFLPASLFVPASFDANTSVTSQDVTIHPNTNLSARLYLPKLTNSTQNKKLPVLVYYHGGAFCLESPFSPGSHRFQNSLVSQANIISLSVNYSLAPERLLPAAYDDSWAALKWAFSSDADAWIKDHGDLDHVFIAGDSAGGNIAHNVAMRAGREGGVKVEGMILIHAEFWGTKPIGGEPTDRKVRSIIESAWSMVNKDGVGVDDPTSNPMAVGAPSLAGLGCRRVMVCVAGNDFLRYRGYGYYEALMGSGWGGKAELVVSKGENHDFIFGAPNDHKTLELMKRFVAFFKHK